MKKIALLFVILCLGTVAMAQNTYVLCVGVSHYQDSSSNLKRAAEDARRSAKVFKKHTENVTVITSKYATNKAITDRMKLICEKAKPEDRIIFTYSGHGFRGGIVTYDAFLLYDEILTILNTSKASLKVCFFDACRAGSILSKDLDGTPKWGKVAGDESIVIFTGCTADELSIESTMVSAGLFTNAFLKGIQGLCDINTDKSITIYELFTYIYNDVTKHSQNCQHPQLICTQKNREQVILKW